MDVLHRVLRRLESGENAVIVTVAAVGGSAPPRAGFKMVVTASETSGTVGGGALEAEAIRRARTLLAGGGAPALERIDVRDLDMTCGGEVTLFFEPFLAAPALWIFGAGHIGSALAPMAAAAGFAVTVVDDRPAFADEARFAEGVRVLCMPYGEAAKLVPKGAFAVIVTHGHIHDEELLGAMLRKEPRLPYVGMIGSASKIAEALDKLRAAGVDPGPDVYAPIGLDLGGDSPGEIALAIAAQAQGIRRGKADLPHYRDKKLRKAR